MRALLVALLCCLPVPAQTGALAGRVEDAAQRPVEGALVFVCTPSGEPLSLKTRAPLTEGFGPGRSQLGLVRATTDADGRFRIQDLPVGGCRLIAQSWRDVDVPKNLFEVNGRSVELRGVLDGVEIEANELTEVTMRPVGAASLELTVDVANDWTVCVVSTWPPRADPILGFVGWGGKFLRNAIAANRMPGGKTTFTGLPAGKVFFTLFANDNNPGFGAGEAEVRIGETTKCRTTLVADWSDGRHTPPEALVPLVERVREWQSSRPNFLAEACARSGIEIRRSGPFQLWTDLAPHADKRITVPGGTEARLADVYAAVGYLELAERVAKRQKARQGRR